MHAGIDALTFRWAGENDIDAILGLAHSAYRGDASRAGWTTEADFLDGQRTDEAAVASMLQGEQGIVMAFRGVDAVACCNLHYDGDDCWFGLFAVSPRLQGAGIGDALLARAEDEAVARFKAQRMRMKVIWLRDSLIAWYERRGYRRIGQTYPFPYGDTRFGLPKRDDLHFIVLEKLLEPISKSI